MDDFFRVTLRLEEPREEIDWQKIAAETKRPLSPEARRILAGNSVDFRQVMTLHQTGLPLPSDGEPFVKRVSTPAPAPAARAEKLQNGWTLEFADDGSVLRGYAPGIDPAVAFAVPA